MGSLSKSLEKLSEDIAHVQKVTLDCWPIGALESVSRSIVGDWMATDVMAPTRYEGKGRGVKSLRKIHVEEILIVQRPRWRVYEEAGNHELITASDSDTHTFETSSSIQLKAQLTKAAATDALLSSALSVLEDNSGIEKPLVPWGRLLNNLNGHVLPLLSQHPRFFPQSEHMELSHTQISSMASVNSFGSQELCNMLAEALRANKVVPKDPKELVDSTDLYPAISLFNHSSQPNCSLLPIFEAGQKTAMVLLAAVEIPPDTELTICYHHDPDTVKRKWHITS